MAGVTAEALRLAGDDRFETATAISEDRYPDGADTVYLARSDDFPDALAAGPTAAADDAPVLLTEPDELHETTEEEIERLDPEEVVLLGGDTALSSDVASEVEALVGDTSRVFGADRVATAAEIARERLDAADTVLIARDDDFADALAGVPAALALEAPVLLTDQDALSEPTEEIIDELGADQAILLGGEQALADTVATDLDPLVDDVDRVFGAGRAETAAEIPLELFDADDVDSIFLATGGDFPDALAGGPAAALEGAPMLLTASLPEEVADAMATLGASQVTGLGGDAVLSDADLDAGADAAGAADLPDHATPVAEATSATGSVVADADEPEGGLGVVDPVDFEAFTIEGQGDDVIDLSVPDDAPAVASISHEGESNFIVEVDVDDELRSQDLLVNAIGDYDGQQALNLEGAVSVADVTADGPWTIEVAPLAEAAQDFDDREASGTGDAVLWAPSGVGGAVDVAHDGESNFIVSAVGDYRISRDLVINEIGSYEGTVRLEDRTVVVTVTADGDWSISPG